MRLGWIAVVLATACEAPLVDLPELTAVPRTDRARSEPARARSIPPDSRSPANVAARAAMLEEGLGDETEVEPEAHTDLEPFGAPPAPGAAPRLLARFAHLADLQITDDESPTRLASADAPGPTSSAFRPQDAYSCHLARAMVRSLTAYHREEPLDFVVLGGDNIDSAQQNELDWALGLLGGAPRLECDSGDDDDPVPGPGNDPKDPFVSAGLPIPWYWVNGNHDVLVQGNIAVDDEREQLAISDDAPFGTRHWDREGGPVRAGRVAPDARRAPLRPVALLEEVAGHGDGHGVSPDIAASGEANYTFDVAGTPLRFLVVDTASEVGGASGSLRRRDVEQTIVPALDAALAEGRWVIVVSHHSPRHVTHEQQPFAPLVPDAVPAAEWVALLTSHPAVFFVLSAHTHENTIGLLEGERDVLEIATASVLDHPHQSRVLEIWDDDNGFVRVRTTMVDVAIEGDELAREARRLGVLDFTSGWASDGRGLREDRNVVVHVPRP